MLGQGDLQWRRSRVNACQLAASRTDTRESPVRVQLKKLTGNVTTHGDLTARLP